MYKRQILEDAALHEKYSGKKYDMVEANIVADIIIALTKQVPDLSLIHICKCIKTHLCTCSDI